MFPPLALVPLVLSKSLAEHVNGQIRWLILVAPCWMEAPWLPTVLNMLADVPQWKEWAGWCAQWGLPNNAIFAPKLANFLLHLFQVGLAWCTIGIYHSAISAFLERHQIHKASNHPVISELMCHI